MKTNAIFLILRAFLVSTMIYLFYVNKSLRDENLILQNNVESLMRESNEYETELNMHARETYALRLTIDELKKYRADDLALIKTLNTKGRDISSISTTSTVGRYDSIAANVRDSIVYRDRIVDTLKCFKAVDPWFVLQGCISKDGFSGSMQTVDSLLYVETIQRKRFLGFLWKTSKIKNRKQDIISKNPNVKIQNLEFIRVDD